LRKRREDNYMKTISQNKIIDFQKWKEKKIINNIFGSGFVEAYVPDYDTVTYTLTIDGEDFKVTVPTENLLDPM
jgi:hypothetical protein